MAKFTDTRWFVIDLRATTLRMQGWSGDYCDRILIVDAPPSELSAENSAHVVARISMENRDDELRESNMDDARLIAAAPELLKWLQAFLEIAQNPAPNAQDRTIQWASVATNAQAAIHKATGES